MIRNVDVAGVRFGFEVKSETPSLPHRIVVWNGARLMGAWEMKDGRISNVRIWKGLQVKRLVWRVVPGPVRHAIERELQRGEARP